MGIHDSGYKQLFAFPAMVEDLLRGFVRERWVDERRDETIVRRRSRGASDGAIYYTVSPFNATRPPATRTRSARFTAQKVPTLHKL